MTTAEYTKKIEAIGFEEFPYFITGREIPLGEIVNYSETELQLKLRLVEVIIGRCFPPTGGIYFPKDSTWFITNFLDSYTKDYIKPWLTQAIKEAMEMILSTDIFTKRIIATTFMFGIVEFYVKHLLGYRPMEFDFFDNDGHRKFRNMFIGDALNKLKRTNTEIGKSISRIDKNTVQRLKEIGIKENRWIIARIADRLNLARNTMLHGENHSFYDKGAYLIMLYILFYLHDGH